MGEGRFTAESRPSNLGSAFLGSVSHNALRNSGSPRSIPGCQTGLAANLTENGDLGLVPIPPRDPIVGYVASLFARKMVAAAGTQVDAEACIDPVKICSCYKGERSDGQIWSSCEFIAGLGSLTGILRKGCDIDSQSDHCW
jgi:hypothetical protein